MKLILSVLATLLLSLGFKVISEAIDPTTNNMNIESINEYSNSNEGTTNGWKRDL